MGGQKPKFFGVFILLLYEIEQSQGETSTERASERLISIGLAVGRRDHSGELSWQRPQTTAKHASYNVNEGESTNHALTELTSAAVLPPPDESAARKDFHYGALLPRSGGYSEVCRTRRTARFGSPQPGARHVFSDVSRDIFREVYNSREAKYRVPESGCAVEIASAVNGTLRHHRPACDDQDILKRSTLNRVLRPETASRNASGHITHGLLIQRKSPTVDHRIRPSFLNDHIATSGTRKRTAQQETYMGGVLLQDAGGSTVLPDLTAPKTPSRLNAAAGEKDTTYGFLDCQIHASAPISVSPARDAVSNYALKRQEISKQAELPTSTRKNLPAPDRKDRYMHTLFHQEAQHVGFPPKDAVTLDASQRSTDITAKETPPGTDVNYTGVKNLMAERAQQTSDDQFRTPQWVIPHDNFVQEAPPDFQTLPPSAIGDSQRLYVPGNMTEPVYQQELASSIEQTMGKCGRCTPVIHFRWHSQESFVDAASHVLNTAAETPVRRIGVFRKASISTLGPIRQWPSPFATEDKEAAPLCPFVVPSVHELLATLAEDSTGPLAGVQGRATSLQNSGGDGGDHPGDTLEETGTKETREPILLRWAPFGLRRKLLCSQDKGLIQNEKYMERTEAGFISALQQKLALPALTPDGHFVVLAYGRHGQIPLDTAFLDRALVRIPKADDIREFVENLSSDSGKLLEAEDDSVVGETRKKDAKPRSQDASPIGDANYFVLNPFTDLLLRFNYREVDSVSKYAVALTEELRETPITFHYRNETRRVAIVLLTEYPEAENAFPSGLIKLTMIVQATIAVSMIIAFLTCLCMCRMMYLLKSR